MDILKQIFPFSFKAKDAKGLIASVAIYIAVGFAGVIFLWALSFIPILDFLSGILGFAIEVYVIAGVVLAFVDYFKLIK